MEENRLISILIPAYNEGENIVLIYERLKQVLIPYNYEMIFVDDGSNDDTERILEDLSSKDNRFKYLQFSRNFGKESAISAGLDLANGCAVLTIDADLQHPVELIPEFIKRWELGFDVVVGVRMTNKGEGFVKKFGSFMFYKIMNIIGETKITPRATDFRLLDRKVVLAFRQFTEHDRMARGLIDWLGFKRDYVYFNANARSNGKAAYNNIKLFRLAFNSMISHSLFPLKLAGYLGVLITIGSGGFGFYLMICKYLLRNEFGRSFSGSAQLAILTIFLVGLVLVSLGLIALYIANIKSEVANRPTYVIRKKNFK
ncbi:MAG: glycosyltransferase family 2 protein [Candidatus Pacebacteria bacterium]|nr:glycosyltransferase family 2 protein [Candidatus Paceibacterota bacterium]